MEFIAINTLKEISSYSDMRSIRKWVSSLGITLLRVGKTYCVSAEEFNKALANKYETGKTNVKPEKKYKPEGKEMEYVIELTNHLRRVSCMTDEK